jgi:response regulator of citrate/malate metabolism
MVRLFRRPEEKKSDMENLLILKKNLQRESRKPPSEIHDFEHIKNRLEEISEKLSYLHERIDNIEGKKPQPEKASSDGVKKARIKKIIEKSIRDSGKLTTYDLSHILNLSRTRCSEYLNEMERAGVIKGVKIRRKRYYEIRH